MKKTYNIEVDCANCANLMAELCASAPVADMANPYAYQSTYIDWPVADYYNETGELKYYALGMDMYMPDISIYTDR